LRRMSHAALISTAPRRSGSRRRGNERAARGGAVLPAGRFADGPPSGSLLGPAPVNGVPVPFSGQPVQGFSGAIAAGDGRYWVMEDNGYGHPAGDRPVRRSTAPAARFRAAGAGFPGPFRLTRPGCVPLGPQRLIVTLPSSLPGVGPSPSSILAACVPSAPVTGWTAWNCSDQSDGRSSPLRRRNTRTDAL
jgi:hypothetical protein